MLCLICFVAPLGIQTVLLPWLIVVEMQETGARLGLAQFALQLPAIVLILAGGLLADRFDRAKILWVCHGLAALPALMLAYVIYQSGAELSNGGDLRARDGLCHRFRATGAGWDAESNCE